MAKARKKISRKELKQPDEFLTVGRQVLAWVAQHRGLVIGACAGVLAVLAAAAGISLYRSAKLEQANAELAEATTVLRQGDLVDAARALREVAERWPGLLPGKLAAIAAAGAELRAGNAETAVLLYEKVLRNDGSLPDYARQEVLFGLGSAFLEVGRAKDAAQRLGEAAAIDGPYAPYALLAQAEALESLGRTEEADRIYDDLLKRFPDLPQRALIEGRKRA